MVRPDGYGIQQLVVNKTNFTCANIGENEVESTVIDSSNNSASAKDIFNVIGAVPAPAITVSRTSPVYTGPDLNTIYLGYGEQQLKLTATNATAAQYSWTPAILALSDSTIATPLICTNTSR